MPATNEKQGSKPTKLIPPTQSSPWYVGGGTPSSANFLSPSIQRSKHIHHPSSVPSYGSSSRLNRMRKARRDANIDETNITRRSRSASIGSSLMDNSNSSSPSSSLRPTLTRKSSNPFLRKPLHISTESLPLLGGQQQQQSFGSMMSIQSSNALQLDERHNSDIGSSTHQSSPSIPMVTKELQPPPVSTHGHVERHLTLMDLIAVGVGGTLGTGFFLLCSLLSSSYAGPASIFCWLLSAVPALLSGFCFAELAGQIPAAGSTYAYAYASMGELPAVVAAGCLSLEYLVSASAIARGWGDKMVKWIITKPGIDNDGFFAHMLQPGYSFNPLSFLLSALVSTLLLGGVKESKAVTNYGAALTILLVVTIISAGFGLLNLHNLKPFLPSEFGLEGLFMGGTLSFMGYLGYDEVCCLTVEAIEPQKNMPKAIMWSIAILTFFYMAGTFALSGMLPYEQISSVGGFPDAFEYRDLEWASTLAALAELVTLPLVVLVAIMAQPRLTFALACDGLISPWFGQVDEDGTFWNGTLFAGSIMTLIASFVPLEFLNDLISAGVLVAFSMTNSSLLLLRLESPDSSPGLLEKLLTCFNFMCFVTSLMLNYICTSIAGKLLTGICCVLTLVICILLKQWCPAASYFGGKTRRSTTQHMTVGIRSVEEEYFKTPLLPFLPCLGIAVNWYLIAQLQWTDLVLLALFLSMTVVFYFSFGFQFSVGNNGGWDAYESCGLSIHSGMPSPAWGEDGVYRMGGVGSIEEDDDYDSSTSTQGLPLED